MKSLLVFIGIAVCVSFVWTIFRTEKEESNEDETINTQGKKIDFSEHSPITNEQLVKLGFCYVKIDDNSGYFKKGNLTVVSEHEDLIKGERMVYYSTEKHTYSAKVQTPVEMKQITERWSQ